MSPDQERQKERARMEAEKHLYHSAVDRLREEHMMEHERMDHSMFKEDKRRAVKYKDANGAYASQDKDMSK